jgi:branched-chain amino acid transport system ATP-binding protein
MSPTIEARDLSIGYGNLVVGRSINFEVHRGEIFAILGPNGAGKTTLLRTLAGFLPPINGMLSVFGAERSQRESAQHVNAQGVVLLPDNRALFGQLSTLDNLRLAQRRGGPSIDEMFDHFPPLRLRVRTPAGMLSGGEQQMLALARSLIQKPRVLLIDEMSMGLAPIVLETLIVDVRRVVDDTGTTVLLVEQHVRLALEIADRAIVMVHGEVTLTDSAVNLTSNVSLLEQAYLGVGIPG